MTLYLTPFNNKKKEGQGKFPIPLDLDKN